MKIGFIASSGGHWEEILCLDELIKNSDCFFVTEQGAQSRACSFTQLYTCRQINRHEKFFIEHFVCLWKSAVHIIKEEKPDAIISTGALMAFPFMIVAKLFGAKIIYIESFARIDNMSLTGKLIYPFADLFCVQWKSMLKKYPRAKYIGGIF